MILDLLFGTYRQRVLSQLLLNPEVSYHVRELARLTGTAAGTLHKELSKLAKVGVLTKRQQGNQVRYQANLNCPVFPELAGLFRKSVGAVSVLAEALRPLMPTPQLVLVFGSMARGDARPDSDVDVLVVSDCDFATVVKALYPAQAVLQREINPVVYNAVEFSRRVGAGEYFVRSILANPHLFVIGNADDLGKLVGHSSTASV
ncbi:MAG: nucleotidyltransferase domain-containing protein [Azonexus sp.]|nr:nucleotidyltransferase domain-containing protein [Azonexus sp.]MCK6412140.1 nucleotidyltransferase domain-containing protein [Azonexus sp.]